MDAHALGQYLREARETKELSLDQAEKVLKIRKWILEGFEQGNFNVLEASPVQIRGIIRNYARYLGLDEELVLQFYDSALDAGSKRRPSRRANPTQEIATDNRPPTSPRRPTAAASPQSAQRPARRGRRLLNLLTVFVLAAAAVSVITYVTLQIIQTPAETFSGTPVVISSILQESSPTNTLPPFPTSTLFRTATLFPRATQNYTGEPVLVTVEMRQRAWVRILVDGAQSYAGLATPGMVFQAPALNEVRVSSSSAGALLVTYNGQQQPLFGARGQAIDLTFGINGVEVSAGAFVEPVEPSLEPALTEDLLAATVFAAETPSRTPGVSPTPSHTPTETFTPSPTIQPTDTVAVPPSVTPLPAFGETQPTPLPGIGSAATQPVPTVQQSQPVQPTPQVIVASPTSTAPDPAIVPPRLTPTNATPVK